MSHSDLGNRGARTEPQTPLVSVVGGAGASFSGKGYPLAKAGLPAKEWDLEEEAGRKEVGIAERQGFPQWVLPGGWGLSSGRSSLMNPDF